MRIVEIAEPLPLPKARGRWPMILRDLRRNKHIYLMLLPVVLYYLIFHYGPMYGAVIAFQDFNPVRGVFGSKWVGLENFQDFLSSVFFWIIICTTLCICTMRII